MKHTILAAAAAVVAAAPLAAQPTLGLDAAYNSGYVSRGLSLTSRPVAQGSATLTLPAGGFTFSGGAWGNLEAAQYAGADELSMTSGETGPNLTEVDLWADATRAVGPASVTVGVLRMTFPNAAVFTSGFNTTDVYARVAFARLPLAPRVSVNYDVDKVQGAYVEGALSHAASLGKVPLAAGVVAGWSNGQALHEGSDEGYYFAKDGLTHVDAWVSTSLQAGPLRLAPAAHVVFGRDELTRTVAPERSEDVKVWLGVSASWSTPLARRR